MVARLGRSCLSKTIDLMRFIKREEPDTPVRAYLALMSLGLFGRPGRSFGSGWLVLFWVSDTFGDSDSDYLKNHVRNVRELQLQTLDGPECGSDRIKLPRTRLLVTIDDLEFGGEIAQQIEAFVELVT